MTTHEQKRVTEAEPEITLGSLVREALAEVDGVAAKAISRVYYQLRNDKTMLEGIIKSAIRLAVMDRTHHAIADQRRSILRSVNTQSARIALLSPKERVLALATGIKSALLDTPLSGGRKLRDASHVEIRAQIEDYEKRAGTMLHMARWLRLVMQSVPEGCHVGDVITEERALELFETSQAEAA